MSREAKQSVSLHPESGTGQKKAEDLQHLDSTSIQVGLISI